MAEGSAGANDAQEPVGLGGVIPLRWMLGLPPWLKALVADQPVWRWIGLFLVVTGCVTGFNGLRHLAARLNRSSRTKIRTALWIKVAVPVGFALLMVFLREIITHNLRFSAPVYAPMMVALATVLYLTVIWIIWVTGQAIAETVIVSRRLKTWSIDGQLIRLTVRFVALVLSVAVLVEGASRLGLPAYSVVAGLGVSGIAVALAARESLANLMGSFTIMIEKPFRIGHWVRVGDTEGTVEAIGFRSTRIRTFYDSLVSVPSSKLMESMIDNLGERTFRRVKTTISVTYDTPPQLLREFVDAIREIIATHPYTRKDNYHTCLQDLADSSLQILLYFFLQAPDWATELRQREDVLLRIIECAERFGVKFAFPTRTLHIAENIISPIESRAG